MTGEEQLFGGRPERTRWLFVLVGIVINLCLGSVYAYSIFKPAVEKVHGVKALMGNLPFMAFLLFFSISMFFSGRLMGRLGPRRLALATEAQVRWPMLTAPSIRVCGRMTRNSSPPYLATRSMARELRARIPASWRRRSRIWLRP